MSSRIFSYPTLPRRPNFAFELGFSQYLCINNGSTGECDFQSVRIAADLCFYCGVYMCPLNVVCVIPSRCSDGQHIAKIAPSKIKANDLAHLCPVFPMCVCSSAWMYNPAAILVVCCVVLDVRVYVCDGAGRAHLKIVTIKQPLFAQAKRTPTPTTTSSSPFDRSTSKTSAAINSQSVPQQMHQHLCATAKQSSWSVEVLLCVGVDRAHHNRATTKPPIIAQTMRLHTPSMQPAPQPFYRSTTTLCAVINWCFSRRLLTVAVREIPFTLFIKVRVFIFVFRKIKLSVYKDKAHINLNSSVTYQPIKYGKSTLFYNLVFNFDEITLNCIMIENSMRSVERLVCSGCKINLKFVHDGRNNIYCDDPGFYLGQVVILDSDICGFQAFEHCDCAFTTDKSYATHNSTHCAGACLSCKWTSTIYHPVRYLTKNRVLSATYYFFQKCKFTLKHKRLYFCGVSTTFEQYINIFAAERLYAMLTSIYRASVGCFPHITNNCVFLIFKISGKQHSQENINVDEGEINFPAADYRTLELVNPDASSDLGPATTLQGDVERPVQSDMVDDISKLSRAQRRAFFKAAKKNGAFVGDDATSTNAFKRLRSDDTVISPAPKREKPARRRTEVPDDLDIVVDNEMALNGALTVIQINQIREELALRLLSQDKAIAGPKFEYAGSGGGMLRLRCMNPSSKEWLVSNVNALNSTLQGAKLRIRCKSEVSAYLIGGFFPFSRSIDSAVVMGLLLRQNESLHVEKWRVVSFKERKGKDPNCPSVGAGYYVQFEIDEESNAALQVDQYRVFFVLTSVTMKPLNKKTATSTLPVLMEDASSDVNNPTDDGPPPLST